MPGLPSSIRGPALRRADPVRWRAAFFLKVIACRLKKRRTAASEVFNSRPANSRCTVASSVRSGSAVIKSSSQAACGSNGERLLPPLGRGLTLPVWPWSSAQRTADAALTLNRFAACRRETPAKISETTRDRRSSECGTVPMLASESETTWTHAHIISGSHPSITFDSTQLPDALSPLQSRPQCGAGLLRDLRAGIPAERHRDHASHALLLAARLRFFRAVFVGRVFLTRSVIRFATSPLAP